MNTHANQLSPKATGYPELSYSSISNPRPPLPKPLKPVQLKEKRKKNKKEGERPTPPLRMARGLSYGSSPTRSVNGEPDRLSPPAAPPAPAPSPRRSSAAL